jgi:uncharacterized Zn finger protein (UPF0148 family)
MIVTCPKCDDNRVNVEYEVEKRSAIGQPDKFEHTGTIFYECTFCGHTWENTESEEGQPPEGTPQSVEGKLRGE